MTVHNYHKVLCSKVEIIIAICVKICFIVEYIYIYFFLNSLFSGIFFGKLVVGVLEECSISNR